MAPWHDISLEVQAFPQLEAIGEPLGAPVIWKARMKPQVALVEKHIALPSSWGLLTEQQPHISLL